ncbi:phosphatidylglycerophosphatase [Mobiluncus mulieris]|nr:phosphatidylglycerophosphatase [Mobiluncus mulieris]
MFCGSGNRATKHFYGRVPVGFAGWFCWLVLLVGFAGWFCWLVLLVVTGAISVLSAHNTKL